MLLQCKEYDSRFIGDSYRKKPFQYCDYMLTPKYSVLDLNDVIYINIMLLYIDINSTRSYNKLHINISVIYNIRNTFKYRLQSNIKYENNVCNNMKMYVYTKYTK